MGINGQPVQPKDGLDPQYQNDLNTWLAAKAQVADIQAQIQKLLLAISTGNVMWNIIQLMSLMSAEKGAEISTLAAVDNLDTDLRDALSSSQGSFNNMMNGKDPTKTTDAQNLLNKINGLENFIKYEQSLPADQRVVDGATLSTLQSQVNSIKAQFGSDWGNPQAMNIDAEKWRQAGGGGGSAPQVKAVTDAFNIINQSVSALSATTNTQLQFTQEQYKQYIGQMQTNMDATLTMTSAMVRNQVSK